MSDPTWRTKLLQDPTAFAALTTDLPASALWSLLLEVLAHRARTRTPAELLRQWSEDEFTGPAPIDQRRLHALDARLFQAAHAFTALELSPLAPLGMCSVMGRTSQNKIVSALRGTEVVSDSTNALALECARRLRDAPASIQRLCTSQRVVRAQRLPPRGQRQGIVRHFGQHFRLFALATAAREQRDHAVLVAALREHIQVHLDAWDLLEQDGYRFPDRVLRLLAVPGRAAVVDRVAADLGGRVTVVREVLTHDYYNGGLRFQISSRSDGMDIPLSDGGSFDWVARLGANQRLLYCASGMGAQLVAAQFGPG